MIIYLAKVRINITINTMTDTTMESSMDSTRCFIQFLISQL